MFEIKLANGVEASFDDGASLCDWYERMVPKVNNKKKDAVDSKKTVNNKEQKQ